MTHWPNRFPRFATLGAALSCVVCAGWFQLWSANYPDQRFYLRDYTVTSIYAGNSIKVFNVLESDGTVWPLPLYPGGWNLWLSSHIYSHGELTLLLDGIGILFALGMSVGIYYDARYSRKVFEGSLIRGTRKVSPAEFNRATKGDGIRFQAGKNSFIQIRRDKEANHIQIAGDTGAGKSTVIRDILYQVEERNESAVIFDPDRQYIEEFFDDSRGDWVLNPTDNRCPYWPIGAEANDEAEASAIASGLFPEGPTVQRFFLNHTRAIFAFLLAEYRPSCAELAHWMAHPDEIDQRVEDTEHRQTLTEASPNQRSGVIGSMNEAGRPLRMMPGPEGRRVWTAREWAGERQGWIFITSTPDTLEALRPLQSLWLDMLILKLQAGTSTRRVWVVLDELATLNQLPQLHSALTRQRRSGHPIVLGFQGMSQIEALYGKEMAQTILSQAFTNIVLRTSESQAALHLSERIGNAEVERVRESRPAGVFNQRGRMYNSERVTVPVVMDSEIMKLNDLTGYFVQSGKVVEMSFAPRVKRSRAPGLIRRAIPSVRSAPGVLREPESATN